MVGPARVQSPTIYLPGNWGSGAASAKIRIGGVVEDKAGSHPRKDAAIASSKERTTEKGVRCEDIGP